MTVEATLGQEVVAPLLEPIPVVTREFGRAHNRVLFSARDVRRATAASG
jgi:hypothetical protein